MAREYSSPVFRALSFNDANVQPTTHFSAAEVRSIMAKASMRDLRQVGCPAEIFERVLESQAKKLGIVPVDTSSLDALKSL